MTPTALSNRILRESIPYEGLVEFCEREGISIESILYDKKDEKSVIVSFDDILPMLEKAAADVDRDIPGLIRHAVKDWLSKNNYLRAEKLLAKKKAS